VPRGKKKGTAKIVFSGKNENNPLMRRGGGPPDLKKRGKRALFLWSKNPDFSEESS